MSSMVTVTIPAPSWILQEASEKANSTSLGTIISARGYLEHDNFIRYTNRELNNVRLQNGSVPDHTPSLRHTLVAMPTSWKLSLQAYLATEPTVTVVKNTCPLAGEVSAGQVTRGGCTAATTKNNHQKQSVFIACKSSTYIPYLFDLRQPSKYATFGHFAHIAPYKFSVH